MGAFLSGPLIICALCVSLASCGASEHPCAIPHTGVVRGAVVEAVDRDLAEIEMLRIRDDDGCLWTFSTDEALEKNGAHLRLHQVLGQTIEVTYESRGGRLVATALRD